MTRPIPSVRLTCRVVPRFTLSPKDSRGCWNTPDSRLQTPDSRLRTPSALPPLWGILDAGMSHFNNENTSGLHYEDGCWDDRQPRIGQEISAAPDLRLSSGEGCRNLTKFEAFSPTDFILREKPDVGGDDLQDTSHDDTSKCRAQTSSPTKWTFSKLTPESSRRPGKRGREREREREKGRGRRRERKKREEEEEKEKEKERERETVPFLAALFFALFAVDRDYGIPIDYETLSGSIETFAFPPDRCRSWPIA